MSDPVWRTRWGLSKDVPVREVYKILLKSKLSGARCNIIELRNSKDKQNDPFSKITFFICLHFCNDEQAREMNRNIINEVILLQFCSCFFFHFNHFIAFLWRKSAINNESHFPFNQRQIQSANRSDNPLFSLMSPCIATAERKTKLMAAQLIQKLSFFFFFFFIIACKSETQWSGRGGQ